MAGAKADLQDLFALADGQLEQAGVDQPLLTAAGEGSYQRLSRS